jgi:hypothetical protein
MSDGLDFERDEIFGIYNRKLQLLAMAHLAFSTEAGTKACARVWRFGARPGPRAVATAPVCSSGPPSIRATKGWTCCSSMRSAKTRPCSKSHATPARLLERDGSETDAWLRLPPATMDSRVSEMVDERVAETDYHLKTQAKQFWEFLSMVQEIRRGVRKARDQSAP